MLQFFRRLHEKINIGGFVMKDINSLAHTTWNCKYHIVFAPKYRRKVFFGEKRIEIGAILRSLCEYKKVNIIEAEICPDHVHMLVEIKYRHREFWCTGYYVDTVGKNTKKIKEYIANQLKEDRRIEQMTMAEIIDPFKRR